ncbi:hypothetical protein LIER_05779 [Lithospermum erythrorhizon]|uniref:Uncharacterized protein n=1 Tax=Lithospermum erythrorhizon TaxID=34254 RepID=A0AAV3P4E4_LITER
MKKDKVAEDRASKAEACLNQVYAEVERWVAEYTESAEFDLLVGKESAAGVVGFVTKFRGEFPQLLDLFTCFKVDWPEYFEGMSVATPPIEAEAKTVEVADEGAEEEVVAADDNSEDAIV